MLTRLLKYKEKLYEIFVYLAVLLFSIFPYSDKDWGWHFRLGEHLIKTGNFFKNNPFTWTLPNYQWTNHEWLYDPILYFLTKSVGFVGLSVLGAIVCFLTFYLITSLFKLSYWKIAILGFFFVRISETGALEGLRSQVISTLLLSVLIVITTKAKKNIKYLLGLPFLFLLWANMHGTFALGLAVTFVLLGSELIIKIVKKDKGSLNYFFILAFLGIVTFLATLINPFGYKIYLEALKHASSPYFAYIYEWLPITDSCTYCHEYTYFFYLTALAFIFIKRKKLSDLPYIILAAALAIPTINMQRYLPIYAIVTLPALAMYLEELKFDITKYKSTDYLVCLILGSIIAFNLFNRYVNFNFYSYSEKDYCIYTNGCSQEMAQYLIKNPPQGKGFNFYDWGGYFIGKGFPVRLFIDGRMHLWKEADYSPFADYVAMYYNHDYQMFINYNFDWVLVPLNSDISQKIYNTNDIGKWKIQFQDGNSILYIRR